MKKIVTIILSCIFVIGLLSACGSSNPEKSTATTAANGGGESSAVVNEHDQDGNGRYDLVRFAIAADPGDMLPWNEMNNYKKVVGLGIYDTLYDFIDGEYVPCAAKGDPVISEDGINYDIEIYDNIKDWEGNDFTADDVVFCYQQYVDSGYATKFTYFDSIEALDTYKVRIKMTEPVTQVNPLDKVLCMVNLYTKAAWDSHEFATDPVGTGPYKLESYTPGSKVICTARDDYWQTDDSKTDALRKRNVDRIEYIIIAEASQNVVALKNNEIDFSLNVPSENIKEFESNDAYSVGEVRTRECFFLSPNVSGKSICDDINLRLAIFYAIDNVSLANALADYTYTTAFGSPVAADYVSAWDSQETYFNVFDLDLAKDYLAKSKYNGETLKLMASNEESAKTTAQTIQVFLKNAGINVELDIVENTVSNANVEEDEAWDLYLQKCGGNFIVNAYNRVLNRNEHNGRSIGFINDDELQKLFEAANNTDTWSDETVDAVYQYVVEKAYVYLLEIRIMNVVQTKDCTSRCEWDNFVIPNACEFKID